MQFLSRLLKREEAAAVKVVDRAEHDWMVANLVAAADKMAKERGDIAADLQIERETVARLVAKIRDLEPDAKRYRERLQRDREYHANRRSNLKQFRDQKAMANG